MKMIPIDSPHLKVVANTLTTQERHQFRTNISLSRALSLAAPTDISSKLYRMLSSFYVTQLAFGKGAGVFAPFVLIDTGSIETWVQCEGCNPCFELYPRSFSYKESLTYARMSIHDPRCVPKTIFEGSCGFSALYIVSRTVGFMGTDTFFFEDTETGQLRGFKDFAFGCGLENVNIDFGANSGSHNIIAGIVGLSPGPRSFLNQLDAEIKGRFSYCIPSWTENQQAYSTMYFGEDANISGDEHRRVKAISMQASKRFHLYLNGISVDGNRLPIDPSIFQLDEKRLTKGFFIDSGAPYTVLAKSAFNPLIDAIVNYFGKYGWQPMPQPQPFYICYSSYPKDDQSFPSVVFHFKLNQRPGDIDMVLDKDNMFQKFENTQGFCLMVHPIDDPGPCLFGAFQQANFKFLYDVRKWLLFFVPERCQENPE
ncbi:hypothetical protein BVRB_1g023320 [Beta vulgaris subsp. vulgaris]|uniref:Peptidase A1 domain-containing protein n=2 Tax=Beta vulgaris subsp. vulgaris TaxID=3555 RepID=A0A0J8BHG0_BETVV|nr:hypothetical protein BVRB_1g023320 [Beta vulgaris subsp. vulgaris]